MDKYIGMDVDDKKIVACGMRQDGSEAYETLGPTVEAMRAYVRRQQEEGVRVHLAFEISGQAGYLHDALVDEVASVQVANPTQATWIYRTPKKNDRLDARKLALLMRFGELPRVHMPAKEGRQWRAMIGHRAKRVHQQTRAKNRIRAVLKEQGIRRPAYKGGWWNQANRAWMASLAQGGDWMEESWRFRLGQWLGELRMVEGQIAQVTRRLDAYLARHPGGALLQTAPGIGPRTAEALLAYTDDVERFRTAKQYCGYFGVTPKLDESGSTRRLGHISKQGPAVARWLLCESAWRAIRYSAGLRAFFDRVTAGQTGRRKIAIVAVARKLLCIVRAMLRSGEAFNEALVRKVVRQSEAA